MEMLWEELVGGGLLEVLPTALEKVAGGFVMAEVDLGPGSGVPPTPTMASYCW